MNGLTGIKPDLHRRSAERGQTIILVAVSLVSLLAMAALAIDVVTLYVARGEMQRAADAAALAGAKAFVDSGVTTDPTNVSRQALAQTMATTVINSILPQNKIQGVAPVLVAATSDLTRQGNPQITVTLQRTDLPTFFSRIWGTRLSTVSATAVAEAYNAASSQTNIGTYVPIAPKCVKPLLVVNKDPISAQPLVDPLTGAATAAEIGKSLILTQACTTAGPATCASSLPALPGTYYPAKIIAPNPGNLCPSCIGAADYEQSIECCDFNAYSCSTALAASQVQVDMTISHGQLRNQTDNGVQCLVGASPDTLDPTSLAGFSAGTDVPRITAGSGPHSGNLVTTSNSIVNLPIIDADNTKPIPASGLVKVVGFLQVFVDSVQIVGNQTTLTTKVLNVVGCGNNPTGGQPVSGGGFTPIPVRLIH